MPFRVQVQLFFSGELVVSQRFADVGDESSTRMTTLATMCARKKNNGAARRVWQMYLNVN